MDQNRSGSFCCLGISLLILGLLTSCATTVRASWIPNFPAEPWTSESPTNLDLSHWFLTVSYDGDGNFTVDSQFPGVAALNNGDYDIGSDSTLSISMILNPSTGAPISGSLLITGDAPDYAASPAGILLTGSIAQFGFSPTSTTSPANFQFLFNTTGGQLADVYPSIAINLSWVDINFNDFTTSFFDDSGSAQTDTFTANPVPEPTSLSLLCLGTLTAATGLRVLPGTTVLRGNTKKIVGQDATRSHCSALSGNLDSNHTYDLTT